MSRTLKRSGFIGGKFVIILSCVYDHWCHEKPIVLLWCLMYPLDAELVRALNAQGIAITVPEFRRGGLAFHAPSLLEGAMDVAYGTPALVVASVWPPEMLRKSSLGELLNEPFVACVTAVEATWASLQLKLPDVRATAHDHDRYEGLVLNAWRTRLRGDVRHPLQSVRTGLGTFAAKLDPIEGNDKAIPASQVNAAMAAAQLIASCINEIERLKTERTSQLLEGLQRAKACLDSLVEQALAIEGFDKLNECVAILDEVLVHQPLQP